jgi:hypothetical protein
VLFIRIWYKWPKVADAMIKTVIAMARYIVMAVDSADLFPQAEGALVV